MAGTDQHTATRFRRGEICILCVILLLILMILTCAGLISGKPVSPNELRREPANQMSEVGLRWQTPIGLEVKIDSEGRISLESNGPSLPTPIGTFSLYAEKRFPTRNTLTIKLGTKAYVYDLGSQRWEVSIPNDRNHLSRIEYDGCNITVMIPDPVWKQP